MSTNVDYRKTLMCNICRKVKRSDNLKCHMTSKHRNVNITLHPRECHPEFEMITNDARYNNESLADDCKIKELDDSLATYTDNLNFQLQRDDEVYGKNAKIDSNSNHGCS